MVLTTDLSNIMFSSTPKIYTVEIRVDGKALACRRFIQEGQFWTIHLQEAEACFALYLTPD